MLRPKTKKRLIILVTAGIVGGALASALVVYRLHRYEQNRLAFRAAGMQAFQHADYRTAATDLSRYLSNDRIDPQAIYSLAVCRTHLPKADLSHLLDARTLFTRYLELKPDDRDARHQLLDIDLKLGAPADTLSLADSLLAMNPDDVAALSAKLTQLDAAQHYSDALPISLRLNELNPLDLRTQIDTLRLMSKLHRRGAQIIARADQLLQDHPNDPRFQLLRGAAAYFADDLPGTRQWLRAAAAAPPPDADFVLILANDLDTFEMWDDARDLLSKAAAAADAPAKIRAAYAQRLFDFDQLDAALDVLKSARPDDPACDTRLLGLKGLILITRDHESVSHPSPKLDAVLSALKRRCDDDLIAIAWSTLLPAVAADAPAPTEAIRLCLTAVHLDLNNADARYNLALKFSAIGEDEQALQAFRQVAQMQIDWAAPHTWIARILLQRGQPIEAVAEAKAAVSRNPQSISARITFAMARYAALHTAVNTTETDPLLADIEQLRAAGAGDPQLLAIQVDLLARRNRRGEAIDLAHHALPAAPASLLAMQEIDRLDHLDLSALILDKAASCKTDTPKAALDLVRVFAIAGKPDAAKPIVQAMQSKPQLEWKLATLQARDALGDPQVGLAWESFADAESKNLQVQQATLNSPSASANRALMDRTIGRLRALTGEDSIEWKLARARWQLAGGEDVKNNANSAAAAMAEVNRVAPRYVLPQMIWADALMRVGDNTGAVQHLRAAQMIDPQNPVVALKLANVLLNQGQIQEAIGLLNGLTNSPMTPAQQSEAARLYRQAGQSNAAIALLKDEAAIHPDDPNRDLLLADLLTHRGDSAAAADIYDALMKQPVITAKVVRAAAWFHASAGRVDQARQCLTRLNELPLPAGEKEILLGEFESAFGTREAAAAQLQSAVKAAPKSSRPWLAASGLDLRHRDFTGAEKVSEQGLNDVPKDAALDAMKVRARTLAGLKLDDDMQSVIDSLAIDPTNDAATATLAAIADSQTAKESDDQLCDRLATLVQQYERYIPALSLLVNRDCTAARFDRAERLASRACELLPVDPEPARLLAMVYATQHQWDKAIPTATLWRQRSLEHPQTADLAIATAQIELNHPDQAATQLYPYVVDSIARCAQSDATSPASMTVELYTKSLYLQGRTEDARGIAEPLARQSALWRRRWLRIISQCAKDTATGSTSINQVEALVASPTDEDKFALGEAWCTLGSRFNDTTCLQNALKIVQPLSSTAPVPSDVWLLLGSIDQQLNQVPDAELAFTKALQILPNSPVAKNNLAMVMWLRNEDPKSARQLAESAVASTPANSAMHSTLGEIDQQLNDLESAKTQFELATKLDSENTEALIGLAAVQAKLGRKDPLLIDKIKSLLPRTHAALPPPVQAEWKTLSGKTN